MTSLHIATGAELIRLAPEILFPAVKDGELPQSPSAALQRIYERYYRVPNLSGDNIIDLVVLRKRLLELIAEEPEFETIQENLLFTAPHTHWKHDNIITTKFDSEHNRYLIGSLPVDPDQFYMAVSYFFTPAGACCYEWLTGDDTFARKATLLNQLANRFHFRNAGACYPFGLSFDYRTNLIAPGDFGCTIEVPLSEELSAIYLLDEFPDEREEAVAWKAIITAPEELLGDDAATLYQEIKSFVSEPGSTVQRVARIKRIMASLEKD